jgi:hypothetical protein
MVLIFVFLAAAVLAGLVYRFLSLKIAKRFSPQASDENRSSDHVSSFPS